MSHTAPSREDETRNDHRNAKRNPRWSSQVSFQMAHFKRALNFDHQEFRFAFRWAFEVSSSRKQADTTTHLKRSNTLQHTATHCNILQQTANYCITLLARGFVQLDFFLNFSLHFFPIVGPPLRIWFIRPEHPPLPPRRWFPMACHPPYSFFDLLATQESRSQYIICPPPPYKCKFQFFSKFHFYPPC